MIDQFGLEATQRIFGYVREGIRDIRELVRQKEAVCDLRTQGYINLFENEEMAQQEHQAQIQLGNDNQLLKADALRNHVQSSHYRAGLFFADPEWNYVLNPYTLVRLMAGKAETLGATIYEHTPVLSLQEEADGVLVKTPRGQIRARKVVVATNPFTIDLKGLPRPIQRSVLPVCQYISLVEFEQNPFQNCSGFSDNSTLDYMFGNVKDNLVMASAGNFEFVASRDPQMLKESHAANKEQLARRFPDHPFQIRSTWPGRIGGSLTSGFLAQTGFATSRKNIYVSFIGDGLAIGHYLGKVAADAVMGNEKSIPPELRIGRAVPLTMALARLCPRRVVDLVAPLVYNSGLF